MPPYADTDVLEQCNERKRIPIHFMESITVANIPRNMHPVRHRGRREAKIKKVHEKDMERRSVDAVQYDSKTAHAGCVTDTTVKELRAVRFPLSDTVSTNETVVALATTTCHGRVTILSDAQAACRNFQRPYLRCRTRYTTQDIEATRHPYRLGARRQIPCGEHRGSCCSPRS